VATLRELLSTPYVMTVRPVRDPRTGQSTRRAEFAEIPEWYVEDISPWDALDRLEEELPARLVDAVRAGMPVPRPRPALRHVDAELLLAERGLSAWVPHLDTDVAALAAEPASLPRRAASPTGGASTTAR
jgi:hypothetical protein